MALHTLPKQLQREIEELGLILISGRLSALHLKLLLLDKIKEGQEFGKNLSEIIYEVQKERREDFQIDRDGKLKVNGRICVPQDDEIKSQQLEEAHQTPYSVHPGPIKMYQDLKQHFWWPGMKRDVVGYVEKCLTCQHVKAEHQKSIGLL